MPIFEGWLLKQGQINKAWRRRYFALFRFPPKLYYFTSDRDVSKMVENGIDTSKGFVNVDLIQSVCRSIHQPAYTLEIVTSERIWIVRTNDERSFQSWTRHLEEAARVARAATAKGRKAKH